VFDLVELEKVNATTDGFPFICGTCHKEHSNWDYCRVYLKDNPNPRCIHLKCLLDVVGFSKEEISEAISKNQVRENEYVESTEAQALYFMCY